MTYFIEDFPVLDFTNKGNCIPSSSPERAIPFLDQGIPGMALRHAISMYFSDHIGKRSRSSGYAAQNVKIVTAEIGPAACIEIGWAAFCRTRRR